jgi:hypothetical protein
MLHDIHPWGINGNIEHIKTGLAEGFEAISRVERSLELITLIDGQTG